MVRRVGDQILPLIGPAPHRPDVLVAIGDTHGTDDARLSGTAREAVRDAERVIHTGDFTTTSVLDAFERTATDLAAVYGNNDGTAVRDRLPATRVVDALDRRFVVAHGHEHDETSLSLLARQEGADVAVVGHSHDPGIDVVGAVPVVNPGSHADPRWHRPGYAVFEAENGSVRVRLRTPDGETFATGTV